jgi:hypothetical protein
MFLQITQWLKVEIEEKFQRRKKTNQMGFSQQIFLSDIHSQASADNAGACHPKYASRFFPPHFSRITPSAQS